MMKQDSHFSEFASKASLFIERGNMKEHTDEQNVHAWKLAEGG